MKVEINHLTKVIQGITLPCLLVLCHRHSTPPAENHHGSRRPFLVA